MQELLKQFHLKRRRTKNKNRTFSLSFSLFWFVLGFILIFRIVIDYPEDFSASLNTIFLLTMNNNHTFLTICRFVLIHIDSIHTENNIDLVLFFFPLSLFYFACAVCLICLTVEPCLPIIAPTESLGTRILGNEWK